MSSSVRRERVRALLASAAALLVLGAGAAPAHAMSPITCSVTESDAGTDAARELSNAPKVKLIYAYAADDSPALDQAKLDQIEEVATNMRTKVETASGNQKSLRLDLAPGGCLDLGVIRLPQGSGVYKSNLSAALADASNATRAAFRGYKHYTVLLQNGANSGILGQAQSFGEATPSAANRANDIGTTSVVGWDAGSYTNDAQGFVDALSYTALHETFHSLGAVFHNAPGADGSGHSNDPLDLLCGPSACPGRPAFAAVHIDGGDSYFNIAPGPGSYLSTHWNIARDSLFLCPIGVCNAQPGNPGISLAASTTTPTAGQHVVLQASGGVGYQWNSGGGYQFGPYANGGASYTTAAQSSAVTITVRGFSADGTWSEASVTISPSGAGNNGGGGDSGRGQVSPRAAFTWKPAGGCKVTLDGSSSAPGSAQITSYHWDINGDGRADASGARVTVDLHASKRVVSLKVADTNGNTSTAMNTVSVGSSGSALAKTPCTQRKRTAARTGIKVAGKGSGRVRITITVSKSTAKKLHLKRTTLASKKVTARKGSFATTVKPSAKVRSAIAHARGSITATITTTGGVRGTTKVTIA